MLQQLLFVHHKLSNNTTARMIYVISHRRTYGNYNKVSIFLTFLFLETHIGSTISLATINGQKINVDMC